MKSVEILFKPGYYEWNLYINGEEAGVLQGNELADDIYGSYCNEPAYCVEAVVDCSLECDYDEDFDNFFVSEYWYNKVTGNRDLYNRVREVMITALTNAYPPDEKLAA